MWQSSCAGDARKASGSSWSFIEGAKFAHFHWTPMDKLHHMPCDPGIVDMQLSPDSISVLADGTLVLWTSQGQE